MTKRLLSLVVAAVALAAITPLSVTTSAAEMTCRIPFDFVVNGSAMPAGAYSISSSSGLILLRGERKGVFVNTNPTSGPEDRSGRGKIVFLRTGDHYDLIEVWNTNGLGHEVRGARQAAEERAARLEATPERIVVATR